MVLTVPASFDEEARELTVQAANEAGLENLTLIEENVSSATKASDSNQDSVQRMLTTAP